MVWKMVFSLTGGPWSLRFHGKIPEALDFLLKLEVDGAEVKVAMFFLHGIDIVCIADV